MFIHIMKSGTAANVPNTVLSLVTNTCVSRYVYWTKVNIRAVGIDALKALAYSTCAFGMNLYIADNVKVTTTAKRNHETSVLKPVSPS